MPTSVARPVARRPVACSVVDMADRENSSVVSVIARIGADVGQSHHRLCEGSGDAPRAAGGKGGETHCRRVDLGDEADDLGESAAGRERPLDSTGHGSSVSACRVTCVLGRPDNCPHLRHHLVMPCQPPGGHVLKATADRGRRLSRSLAASSATASAASSAEPRRRSAASSASASSRVGSSGMVKLDAMDCLALRRLSLGTTPQPGPLPASCRPPTLTPPRRAGCRGGPRPP